MNSPTQASGFPAFILRTLVKGGTVLLILSGLFLYNLYFVGRKTINPSPKAMIYSQKFSVATEQNNDSFVPLEACDDIYLHDDRCQFVMRNCDKLGFFDYLYLHYCSLAHLPVLSFAILILLLLFYFYLLGSTAERFFCPVLGRISRALNLSPNVAGVTFLALGNGSPDIFSQIAAVNNDVFETALGTMLGSSLFVGTVVVGAITLAAKTVVTVTRRPFIRDVVFYMIAIVFLFCVCWSNKFYVWEGVTLLAFYFLYVTVVISGRIIHQWSKRRHASSKSTKEETPRLLSDSDDTTENITRISTYESDTVTEAFSDQTSSVINNETHHEFDLTTPIRTSLNDETLKSAISLESQTQRIKQRKRKMSSTLATKLFRKMQGGVIYLAKYGIFGNRHPSSHSISTLREEDENFDTVLQERKPAKERLKRWFKSGLKNFADFFDWEEQSIRSKILTIIDAPRLLIQHCTIHYAEEDKYFRPFLVAQPICIPIFFFLIFDAWNVSWFFPGPLWVWILCFGFVIALVVLMTTKSSEPPVYEWVYIVVGMIMAVVWIYQVASELVSLIWSFGKILGISNAIMGLTVIAWGNSVGDAVSNIIVSRKGHPQMAVSACIAAPLTNLLLGMGFSSLILTLRNGGEFELNPQNSDLIYLTNNMFLAFIFIMFTLVLSITLVPLFKFRYTKQMGVVLILNYVSFTILSFLSEFGILFENKIIWFDH